MIRTRIAVIGAGHLGRIHTRLLLTQPDVEVVGVVDPVPEARQQVTAEFGVLGFAHHDEIANLCDAAIVATNTTQHFDVGRALLQRGVHLFIEKPLAASSDQANQLVQSAKQRSLVLQAGHVEQFNPALVSVRRVVDQPYYIEARRTSGYSGRSTDIGVVMDLMVHDLDLVLLLAQSDLKSVQAVGTSVIGPHEDMAQVRLAFENGCVANLTASRTSYVGQRYMQVFTATGCANVDFATGTAEWIEASSALKTGEFDVGSLDAEKRAEIRDNLFVQLLHRRPLECESRNAIYEEQRDFVGSIVEKRSPRVTGEWAVNVLQLCEIVQAEIASWQNSLSIFPSSLESIDSNWNADQKQSHLISGKNSVRHVPIHAIDPHHRRAG